VLLIILLVLWVMTMFLWLLALLGAVPQTQRYESWLGFFAALVLGLVVFLVGTGVVVWSHSP
jgi:hypothetical protein